MKLACLTVLLASLHPAAASAADPDAALGRMRELLMQRQAQALIAEFGPVDFHAWPQDAAKKTAEAFELRGRAYLVAKDGRRAEVDLREALRIDPQNVSLWLTLGENYFRNLEDDAQALAAFGEVRRIQGRSHGWQNLTAAISRAEILTHGLRADEALAELETLGDPNRLAATWRVKALRAYGHAYAALGKETEALAKFREALAVESESKQPAVKP